MSKLLHSTLFFLDLRVRDVFFLCKYLLTRKSKSISYVLRIILSIIPWKVSSSSRMCQDDLQVAQVEKRFRWFEWCANIWQLWTCPRPGSQHWGPHFIVRSVISCCFSFNGFFFRKFHCFMEWCILAKHNGLLIIMIMDESRIDLYQFLDHCQIWILKPPAIHQPPRLLWLGSRYQRRFSRFIKGDGIKIWQVESCFLWWMVPALMAGWDSLTFMI